MSVALVVCSWLLGLSVLTVAVAQASVFWVLARRRRSEFCPPQSSLSGRPQSPISRLPPISILKPLKGLDPGLEANLDALARQDYPCFEIVVGAEHSDDPALNVARRVRDRHPGVEIRIVAQAPTFGLNPKVQNLAHVSRHARHEVWLISDASTRPGPDYLRDIARELTTPGVGLVHNVLVGVGCDRLGAIMDSLHFNTWVTRAVSMAEIVGRHPSVVGKSMLFRRRDLEALGGWSIVKDILAEDYLLGQRFHRAGLRVVLSSHRLPTMNHDRSMADFCRRQVRWGQMRRAIAPIAYLAELLLNPIPFFMMLGLLLRLRTPECSSLEAVEIVLAGIVFKCAADAWLSRRLTGEWPTLTSVVTIPMKDILGVLLWAAGLLLRRVEWRGHAFFIGRHSQLIAVPDARSPILDETEGAIVATPAGAGGRKTWAER